MTNPTKTMQRHMLNAFFEWAGERGLTPMLGTVINETCVVPKSLSKQPSAWFNVSPEATRDYGETEVFVFFTSRFNGVPFEVTLPWGCVQAVRVKESDVILPLMGWPGESELVFEQSEVAQQPVETNKKKSTANVEEKTSSWLKRVGAVWSALKKPVPSTTAQAPQTKSATGQGEVEQEFEATTPQKTRLKPKLTVIRGGLKERMPMTEEERLSSRLRLKVVREE